MKGPIPENGVIVHEGCDISRYAVIIADEEGSDPIVFGNDCKVMPGAIIYPGTIVGEKAIVEENVVVGKQEHGYINPQFVGSGDPGAATKLGDGAVLRAGAIVYRGVTVGGGTTVGHGTLLRSFVTIGENAQLGHGLTIERESNVGSGVRCSPHCHITARVVLEDEVFLGGGVITVNDRGMIWREDTSPVLEPPYFERSCRVGSGSTIAAGVRIGSGALVGSGSVVTRDVPANSVAYGVPAKVQRQIR